MKKYWTVFKTSWANELEYRLAFFLARLRNIVYLLLLYYIWLSLSRMSGRFAAYSTEELTTYVFGAHLLRSIIFGGQSRLMAFEINDGTFSIYLVKPVSHFWFVFWRELAQRAIYFVSAVVELIVFILLTGAIFLWQVDWKLLTMFLITIIEALFLYFLLTYLVSLFAFWSREAMGPRFLFEWFLEFSSGAFFPLDIFSRTLLITFQFLPFAYVIYFPLELYLGRWDFGQIVAGIGVQAVFIVFISLLTIVVWGRGLRKYSGEGI